MAMQASVILTRATDILQDTTSVRWPEAEMLRWMSDAQREIVLYRPDASVTNTNFQLASGATKQTLPSQAIRLIDVVRNMGAAGSTPGRVIRNINREILDAQIPTWHSDAGAAEVKHFMWDARDPKNFYVYPKPTSASYVEVIYSVSPTEITTNSQNISVDDFYANTILDYMLYRAYSKDAEYTGNAQRAVAHYQAFTTALGIRRTTDTTNSPNTNSVFNPNNPVRGKAEGGAL